LPSRLLRILALFVAAAAAPAQNRSAACPAGVDFEKEGYRVAHVAANDPFRFLYWLAGKSRDVESQLAARLTGKPFTYRSSGRDALAAIEDAQFVPSSPGAFAIRLERVLLRNCDPTAKTLDVVYRIFSTAPPKFLGGAAESQAVAETAPQTTTGLTAGGSAFQLLPTGGYDRAFGAFGGGSLSAYGLSLEGQGSLAMRRFSAAYAGSRDLRGWLRHAAWRLDYRYDSVSPGTFHLQNAALSAQFSAATHAFWNGAAFARFGALVEGGNMQSLVVAGLLPPHTVSNAGYGSLKTFAGISSRTRHNVLSASYGLELGTVGPAARIDWRKHIADLADEFWFPLADHRPLEVESRFTAGWIQVPGSIPLAARFFGGSADRSFIPGDAGWQIRDTPVIRAIPGDRLFLTAHGAGADRFAAVNFTVAYPLIARPIMPAELSRDPEVDRILGAQIATAASLEQNYYAWKDPHFAAALARLPNLRRSLDALSIGRTGDCLGSIQMAQFDVDNTLKTRGSAQYGDLSALLPVDSDDLQAVRDSCGPSPVDAARTALIADFDAIDQARARKKANNDMAFVRRTLETIFHDLNLYSVSPVAVFDAASIGTGLRTGPGAGMRLQIASSVSFTAGYAWNIHPHFAEGRGAVFFSITVRDLFH
jgi:hypothetical protein